MVLVRMFFRKFSVRIHPISDIRSGSLFGYVPGILSVSIIVIIRKTIIGFGIYLSF